MSATRLRKAGLPRAGGQKTLTDLIGPGAGIARTNQPGEHKLNQQQVYALETLFNSNPAIQACRTILMGQLLGGGLELRRDSKPVDLTPIFKRHLDEVWVPFAAKVVDSFLCWGYTVFSIEEDEDSYATQELKRQRPDSSAAKVANLVPVVPPSDTYSVAFVMGGRCGYVRKYIVYPASPQQAHKIDEDAHIVVRNHPDPNGNCCSPLASVFDLASFATALTELGLTAEISNARPRIWTQQKKENKGGPLDPGALFFDTESRAVQSSQDSEENAKQVQALAMQSQMCKIINRLQTTQHGPDFQTGSFSGGGVATGKLNHIPPEVPPALFSIPRDQEVANSAGQMPQARGDLEALQRLAIEQIGASFGVPSDLVHQGRFASKSTAQLSLLNSTVAELAKVTSRVLTTAYHLIYGNEDGTDPVEMALMTSPLAASEEVAALYTAGLAPVEIAMPAVLHSIGASRDQIDAAVKKAVEAVEQKEGDEGDQAAQTKKQGELGLREREQNLATSLERAKVEIEQAKVNLEKSKKEPSAPSASGAPPR